MFWFKANLESSFSSGELLLFLQDCQRYAKRYQVEAGFSIKEIQIDPDASGPTTGFLSYAGRFILEDIAKKVLSVKKISRPLRKAIHNFYQYGALKEFSDCYNKIAQKRYDELVRNNHLVMTPEYAIGFTDVGQKPAPVDELYGKLCRYFRDKRWIFCEGRITYPRHYARFVNKNQPLEDVYSFMFGVEFCLEYVNKTKVKITPLLARKHGPVILLAPEYCTKSLLVDSTDFVEEVIATTEKMISSFGDVDSVILRNIRQFGGSSCFRASRGTNSIVDETHCSRLCRFFSQETGCSARLFRKIQNRTMIGFSTRKLPKNMATITQVDAVQARFLDLVTEASVVATAFSTEYRRKFERGLFEFCRKLHFFLS